MAGQEKSGLNPEQMQKLSNLGTVVKKTETTAKGGQPKVVTPPNNVAQEQSIVNKAHEAGFIEEDLTAQNHVNRQVSVKLPTYICIVDEQGNSSMEIDLITFREKGEEIRYVNFQFVMDEPQENIPQKVAFNITKKDDFESLKAFFSNLNWED